MNADLKTSLIQMPIEVMFTILSGPESGVAYKLVGQTITLGRDADNDVVLPDAKSSRKHACLEQRNGQYWIKDLGSQNGIILNGQTVRECLLKNGDQLMIGSTLIRFGPPQSLSLINSAPPIPQGPLSSGINPTKIRGTSHSRQQQNFMPVIIAVLVIGGLIFFLSGSTSKKKHFDINDDSTLDTEIEDLSTVNDKQVQEIQRKGKDTQQYSEAQAFYQRGFREFRESNFSRAIQNFEAALALYPEHPLAKRYLDRSRLKLNELVTEGLERGEKDFQLQKYSAAFNEYRTVMLLKNDPRDKMYQLAQKRIEAIDLIMVNSR